MVHELLPLTNLTKKKSIIKSMSSNKELILSEFSKPSNGALFADAMNVLKSFIGSNYLVMPFAFAQGGVILGSFALVFIAILTDHCCSLIVICKGRAESNICARSKEEIGSRTLTYGDVAKEAFGDRAVDIVDAILTFTQFGFCVEYFIFVVTTLRSFTPNTSLFLLALVPISFLIPCAFLPSVKSLSPVSAVANVAILIGFVGIISYDVSTGGKDLFNLDDVPLCNWEQFPIFFSITMSCFEGIGTVLPVEQSMASGSKKYPVMLHGAIAFTTGFLGSIGIIGLFRFGKHGVDQIATENLPEKTVLTTCITSALILAILFTFPLQIFPVIQCCEKWVLKGKESVGSSLAKPYNPLHDEQDDREEAEIVSEDESHIVQLNPLGVWFFRMCGVPLLGDGVSFDAIELYGPVAGKSLWKTFSLRTVIILLASLVGLVAVNSFGYIASLVGALGATALSFIIPSLVHMKLFPTELTLKQRVMDSAICFIGVIAAVVGLYTTIKDWIGT